MTSREERIPMKSPPGMSLRRRHPFVVVALSLLLGVSAAAAELRVMTSGAFTAAYLALIPSCAEARGDRVVTAATTMGTGEASIPSRLQRREAADVVIIDRTALEDLIAQGSVRSGSRVDLARSAIGMAVRTGTLQPKITTTDELRHTLLAAGSIAYSASVSGDYLSGELFERLGVASEVRPKSRRIVGERVGAVVARGDAEIGFQQISELLPIAGIEYVGPLPPELQKITVFSAGLAAAAANPQRAAAFIDCLASPEAAAIVARSGLEPRHVVPELRPEFRELARIGPFLAP
jgi:molybdate transport system substrate-binding protein